MGPPSEDGGNQTSRRSDTPGQQLQWGRRPKTAEMLLAEFVQRQLTVASMGPPSEDGGNQVGA